MYQETYSRSDKMKEFANKLAEKLGVPSGKMSAAMQSLRKEWMDQMITERIQEAVQKGTITQVEAGQIRDWLKNRPDSVQKLMAQMFGQMGGMGMGSHMC